MPYYSIRVFIKVENTQEAHLRAEVNHEVQTAGNVASLAAECTEPFPCCACSPWIWCSALAFAFIPPWVSVKKKGKWFLRSLLWDSLWSPNFVEGWKLWLCVSVLGQGASMLLGIIQTTSASSTPLGEAGLSAFRLIICFQGGYYPYSVVNNDQAQRYRLHNTTTTTNFDPFLSNGCCWT